MALRIRLTGKVGIDLDGDVVAEPSALAGRQGRLVLAHLALNHHPVSRDVLAELVWPDGLPRSWERDLSAVVSKLRAALAPGGDTTITGALGCYELKLAPDATVDVEEAVRFCEEAESLFAGGDARAAIGAATAAAAIARRPFLPGESADWVEARRDELRALAGRALHLLVCAQRDRGNLGDAIRHANAAIEAEPYREGAYVVLMRLHLHQGDRAEALRVYERLRARIVEDLGVPPGPEAERAHREALAAGLTDSPRSGGQPPQLLFRDTRGEPHRFVLAHGRDRLAIGRADTADVCLYWDQEVSRVHAILEAVAGGWIVVDDGLSRNGTFLNHELVSGRRPLVHGDVLQVGDTTLTFHAPQPGSALAETAPARSG